MKNEVLGLAQNAQPSSENQDPQVLEETENVRKGFFILTKIATPEEREGPEEKGEWENEQSWNMETKCHSPAKQNWICSVIKKFHEITSDKKSCVLRHII